MISREIIGGGEGGVLVVASLSKRQDTKKNLMRMKGEKSEVGECVGEWGESVGAVTKKNFLVKKTRLITLIPPERYRLGCGTRCGIGMSRNVWLQW